MLASKLALSAQAVQRFPGFSFAGKISPLDASFYGGFRHVSLGREFKVNPELVGGVIAPLWFEHLEVPQKELESVAGNGEEPQPSYG